MMRRKSVNKICDTNLPAYPDSLLTKILNNCTETIDFAKMYT